MVKLKGNVTLVNMRAEMEARRKKAEFVARMKHAKHQKAERLRMTAAVRNLFKPAPVLKLS